MLDKNKLLQPLRDSMSRVSEHIRLNDDSLYFALWLFNRYIENPMTNFAVQLTGFSDQTVGIPIRSILKLLFMWKRSAVPYYIHIMLPPRVPNLETREVRKSEGYCSTCHHSWMSQEKYVPEGEGHYKNSLDKYTLVILSNDFDTLHAINRKKKVLDQRRMHISLTTQSGRRCLVSVDPKCSSEKFIGFKMDGLSIPVAPEMARAAATHVHPDHAFAYELRVRNELD